MQTFKHQKLYLFITFILFSISSYGQGANALNLYGSVPPSPEAASLGKYITSPVSYATGVPEISVPLYTVESGSLKIPVSINYNTSGIKVEEVAASVGLGWSLNSGGSLYRVVRGLPDDFNITNGYMYTSNTVKSIVSTPPNSPQRTNFYNDILSGISDSEPDIYYFSILGYSGRFYFDQDLRQFVLAPRQRLKIAYNTNSNGQITSFTLTLPNGIKCYFGQSKDNSRTAFDIVGNQMVVNYGGTSGGSPGESSAGSVASISAWQLMDIVSPQNDAISYYYTTISATDFGRGGEQKLYAGSGGCDIANNGIAVGSTYVQTSTKSVLNKISGSLGDILFTPSTVSRQDIVEGPKELDNIKVVDKNAKTLKSYALNFDYWVSAAESYTLPFAATNPSVASVATKRLRLNSVTEYDANLNALPPYQFTYTTSGNLPSRLSSAQDFWGYFNGKQNGISLVPKVSQRLLYSNTTGYLDGSDRTIDTLLSQSAVLTSIKYPTGGTTTFQYENNVVFDGAGNLSNSGFQYSNLVLKQQLIYKDRSWQQASDPNQYIYPITIGNVATPNTTEIDVQNPCANMNSLSCPVLITVKGVTNPKFFLRVGSAKMFADLPAGQYNMIVELNPTDAVPNPDFTIVVKWSEFSAQLGANNMLVGGLRVKNIIKQEGTSPAITTSYAYNTFTDPAKSSGQLFNFPVSAFSIACGLNNGGSVLEVSSQSAIPLYSSNGQSVTYTNVAEYTGSNTGKLKSEYDFDLNTDYVIGYPFPDNIKADWQSGTLLERRDFKSIGNSQYNILSSKSYSYTSLNRDIRDNIGIKLISWATPSHYGIGIDKAITEWYVPKSETTINYLYDNNNQLLSSITQSNVYTYNAINQYILSKTVSVNSKGEQLIAKDYFPGDFNSVNGFNVGNLITNNILENPLRKEVSRNGKLISGSVMKYNDAGQVINVLNYENNVLADTTALDPNVILPGSNYTNRITNTYDANNKLVSMVKDNQSSSTYLWGYNNQYPVAEIKNAAYQDVVNVLGQTVINQLNANPGNDAQVRSLLAPLRAALPNSLITIYTYDPIAGMTSTTDGKGMTTYYEYDNLQRLMNIKDKDGNIIKHIDYHYQGQ